MRLFSSASSLASSGTCWDLDGAHGRRGTEGGFRVERLLTEMRASRSYKRGCGGGCGRLR